MTEIERTHNLFQGTNHGEIRREDLLNLFLDAFDTLRYGRLGIEPPEKKIDSHYSNNQTFWHDARRKKHFEGMRVALSEFHLTEWLPSAPGRYFTTGAVNSRKKAEESMNHSRGEYDTLGKYSMILGGVGSIRLLSKDVKTNRIHFLGASSTGISHQGIPIAMSEEVYRKAIQPIRDRGGCLVDIKGTIQALPPLFPLLTYDQEIPKYCVFIEEEKDLTIKRDIHYKDLFVTVTITFSRKHPWQTFGEDEKYREIIETKAWSFCSFNPDPYDLGLKHSIDWLKDYAVRYSRSPDPLVMADFDERYNHFPGQVEFPLAQLSQGRIDTKSLYSYARRFGITIVAEEVVMGDKFENIHNATIVNRSTVQNAFNTVSATHGEETAQALKKIADEIEKSQNKEAAENFNSFSEELQKPEPKKSVLRSLWTGITVALPSILQMTDVVTKISKLFTG